MEGMSERSWERSAGMAVFMLGESGEGLCRRALPDEEGAKPSCADTPTQITILISSNYLLSNVRIVF